MMDIAVTDAFSESRVFLSCSARRTPPCWTNDIMSFKDTYQEEPRSTFMLESM
jgi:hypothetical protein